MFIGPCYLQRLGTYHQNIPSFLHVKDCGVSHELKLLSFLICYIFSFCYLLINSFFDVMCLFLVKILERLPSWESFHVLVQISHCLFCLCSDGGNRIPKVVPVQMDVKRPFIKLENLILRVQ